MRKQGPFGGWDVRVDDRSIVRRDVPTRKVGAFVDGVETGLAIADPASVSELSVEDVFGRRYIAVQAAKVVVEVVWWLLWIGVALYAFLNTVELVRIVATDWGARHFAEHLVLEVSAVAALYLVATGRLRLPWVRREITVKFE